MIYVKLILIMKKFILALQLLTRLHFFNLPFDEVAYGKSSMYFPLVGFLLGLILVFLYLGLNYVFPPLVVAALLITGLIFLSGGLHLEGFMDTMDGILSGRPPERKLEIMRDSRVGAFGVVGLVVLLLLKFTLLSCIPAQVMPRVLILMPALSRWGMVYAIARFSYARPQGIGIYLVKYTKNRELAVAALWGCGVAALNGGAGLILFIWLTFLTHLLALIFTRHLGGLTGDTYGAINELLEVILLLTVFPLLKLPFLNFWW
ncbi:MAG TPA: adenosylcobinamide-GDP ribazoletransferase [Desulfotomaculum sp.]|nr:adenosylcobinamide-GDP ribazoletransferase [Desulfotomaculum sp.]